MEHPAIHYHNKLEVTHQNYMPGAEELVSYNGYILQRVGTTELDYYINGKKIDFSYEYKYNVSVGDSYLNATMKMTTRSTSEVFDTAFTDTNGEDHEGKRIQIIYRVIKTIKICIL